tara:strand:- start:70744 stop:71094 length:351 start_codon:yes stop_codon:yes gene_type:complete
MGLILIKYLSTAAIVVIVSEIAKNSDRLGALIASLPLVTILVLFWMYFESQPQEKIANHAWYTFWYVIPSLPMFFIFPFILPSLGFWLSIIASIAITLLCFAVLIYFAGKLGINLL